MRQPLQFTTDTGVLFEIDVGDVQEEPVADQGKRVSAELVSWEDALSGVRTAVNSLLDTLRGGITPPDEVSIEFAIRVTAEGGAIIAATPTEGQFRARIGYVSSQR